MINPDNALKLTPDPREVRVAELETQLDVDHSKRR